MHVQDSIS